MLRMSAFNANTCPQTSAPLLDCSVVDVLVEATPFLHQRLFKMLHVLYLCSIDSVLQHSPDLVIHWVQVWTVWRPE